VRAADRDRTGIFSLEGSKTRMSPNAHEPQCQVRVCMTPSERPRPSASAGYSRDESHNACEAGRRWHTLAVKAPRRISVAPSPRTAQLGHPTWCYSGASASSVSSLR
jgi:hypothetical protein